MPLAKYYCDYCDKQFQDTPVARRRHLQGAMHQRAKKLGLIPFKSPVYNSSLNQHPKRFVCNSCERELATLAIDADTSM